eukprot:845942-Karenia_brevis.AAC.1
MSPTSNSECSQAPLNPLVPNPCGACSATPPSYANPGAKYDDAPPEHAAAALMEILIPISCPPGPTVLSPAGCT